MELWNTKCSNDAGGHQKEWLIPHSLQSSKMMMSEVKSRADTPYLAAGSFIRTWNYDSPLLCWGEFETSLQVQAMPRQKGWKDGKSGKDGKGRKDGKSGKNGKSGKDGTGGKNGKY